MWLRYIKGLFTRNVSVKIYHCINGNGLFDGQNGFGTHSDCQTDHHRTNSVTLTEAVKDTDTETVTEMVRVNRP